MTLKDAAEDTVGYSKKSCTLGNLNRQHSLLIFLEAKKSKIKAPAMSGEGSDLYMAFSSVEPHMAERRLRKLSHVSSHKGTESEMRVTQSCPTLQL